MDWPGELSRFALHAAVAAAVLFVILGPARGLFARFARRIARMRRAQFAIVVVTLTLVLRLALMPAVHPVYEADIKEYVEKAAAIARDGHPRAEETRADGTHFYRTLGYSLPLAGWYRATGMPETAAARLRSAQLFNLLAAAATTALVLALGVALRRETAGRIAALIQATYLPAAMFALLPYTETWTTLLITASVLLFEKLRTDGAPLGRNLVLGTALGAAQGLLLITRTEFFWMPLLLAGLLVARRGMPGLAAAAASLVLVAGAFAVNHAMRDGYPGTLRTSVQGGLILYFGNNPTEVTGHGNATPEVARHVQELYARDRTGGLARDEALEWMKANPHLVAANAPKKLYHLWLAEPQGFTWHVQAGRASGTNATFAGVLRHAAWVQSLLLLGLGAAALVRVRREFGVVLAILALHAATWCLLAASTRNRYPLEPLLMLAAAAWTATRSGIMRPLTGTTEAP